MKDNMRKKTNKDILYIMLKTENCFDDKDIL